MTTAEMEDFFPSSDVSDKLETNAKYSVDSILDKAGENMDSFNYEVAQMFCQRALDLEPNNVRALEISASLLLEAGELDGSKELLERAIALLPESGHAKYMSLGQLEEGQAALAHYVKGIAIMAKEIEERMDTEQAAAAAMTTTDLKPGPSVRELSTAYCSVAEIYMTDCCFEEDAEKLCAEHIDRAIATDPTNPEAYQYMASYLLVKDEVEKAREMMSKSTSLWLPQYQSVREGRSDPTDEVEVCPVSYPSRINAAKILIELESFDDASSVLEGLVEEDDQVVEVWYLLGWLNYLRKADFEENSRFYLKKCKEVAGKCSTNDDAMMSHVDELLAELGPGENEDDDDNNKENEDDDDEIESSEEEMEQQ